MGGTPTPDLDAVIAATASLESSNAESRIRLIVLLTAPKIFAISSVTDKKIKPQFRKIVGLVFRLGGTPTPETKTCAGVLINGMCNIEDGTRAATAASKSNAELDEKYERLRHVVA